MSPWVVGGCSTRYWPGTALGSWLLAAPDTTGAAAALQRAPLESLPSSWVVAVLDPTRLAALTLNLPVPVQVSASSLTSSLTSLLTSSLTSSLTSRGSTPAGGSTDYEPWTGCTHRPSEARTTHLAATVCHRCVAG